MGAGVQAAPRAAAHVHDREEVLGEAHQVALVARLRTSLALAALISSAPCECASVHVDSLACVCIMKVVLRAPTKRGAVEALDAETKVYVEFFDSFDEDKRSRYVLNGPLSCLTLRFSMT